MGEEEIKEQDQEEQQTLSSTAKTVKTVGVITIIAGVIFAADVNAQGSSGYGDTDTYHQAIALVTLVSGILTGH